MNMLYEIDNKVERAALKRLSDLQLKVKQLRLQENLAKQDFHYDASIILSQ